MKAYFERLWNGLIKENPVLVLMLGMCPALAVSTQAANGIGMGLSTLAVLVLSNFVISCLRKVIPDQVRLPSYIVIVASLVTVTELLIEARIVESETAVDDELIDADIPPVMDIVIGVIGDYLDMRIDLIAVLRRKERGQKMRVDDDIGLHLFEHLKVLPARAAVDGVHHKRQRVVDAANMGSSHLDIGVPREDIRPLDFLHVALLHFLQQRIAVESILTD